MKAQFYPIATRLKNFLALLITLFIINHTCAQDVLINADPVTWGWFDNYPSHTVNGNLTITGAIPDLVELGDSFWSNLSTVTGDLIIKDCTNLVSLNGLQFLTTVGGNVIIENCGVLSTLQGLDKLISVGGDIVVSACSNLISTGTSNFQLQSTNRIEFQGNPLLSSIDPFINLTACNYFNLINLPILISYSGMNGISSMANIWISNNSSLISFFGFQQVNSLNYLEISNNANLTNCCFASHLVSISNIDVISGNALQCISPSAINAPPYFDICPPNNTISTDINSCSFSYPVRLPIASDNCDLQNATVKITLGDGSIWFDGVYGSPGNTFNYPVNPGINTFEFIATDMNGNTGPCNTVITVEDNQAPIPPAGFPVEFYIEADSDCIETFSVTAEGFVDNCAIDQYRIQISQGGTSIADEMVSPSSVRNYDLGIGNYTYSLTAFDISGLSTTATAPIIIKDGSAPVWNASNLVKVVEIECGETSIQAALTANFPTATDCSGSPDVIINETFNNTTSCGLAENRYLIIAKDGFGATNAEQFDLTIREIDTKKPILTGVPNNVTIGCNDAIPSFPNLTASDLCDGNLTSMITFTEIPGMGTCGNGQIAQTFARSASISDQCGNTTTAQWTVTVLSDFTFSLGEDIVTCDGAGTTYTLNPQVPNASYSWSTGASSSSISVNTSGIYKVTVTTANGCCYSDEIEVKSGTIPNISALGGTIDCSSGTVQLSGSSSTSGATFAWTGPENFTASSANPFVSNPGEYTLVVQNAQGCENSQTVTVDSDTNVPNAGATGGSLTCINTSIQIKGNSSTPGVTFSWTGPNNFQSSEQNPTVDEIGNYTLTVTGQNGCKSVTSAAVIGNTDIPAITLNADQINCKNPSVKISLVSDVILTSTDWTGPNNFSSTDKEPSVDQIGTYVVTVKSVNGCEVEFSIEVTEDLTTPDVIAVGGTISCDENAVELSSSSTDSSATFLWNGPDNFSSTKKNPQVSQPGTYHIIVIGLNGCSIQDSVMVMADTNLPNVSASGGTIDCINEEVKLIGSSLSEGVTIKWTGPNGFESNKDTNIVFVPGPYTFTVVSPGGCTAFKTVEVILDNQNPDLSIAEGNVDCASQTRQFNISTNITEVNYSWEGPDGFTSDLPFPSYSLSGIYGLTITGANGCITSQTIEIENDIALSAEVNSDGSNAEVEIISGTGPFTYIWDGEFGLMEASDLEEGEHDVTVIDGLGCSQNYDFIITTSSIEEIDNLGSIKIHPNPSQDILNINLKGITLPLEYTIYSIDGMKITTGILWSPKNSINVENYRSGIYLLTFRASQKTKVLKFVKK